jgi:hypothetical protein
MGQAAGGVVKEELSNAPVGGVAVVLVDSNRTVRGVVFTDADGRYLIRAPAEGVYRLSFQRAGLAAFDADGNDLKAGRELRVDVLMARASTTLPTVDVIAKPVVERPAGNTHKYDEFLRRRSFGVGHFMTREELDAKPRERMQDVFNGIPGIKVREDGTRWYVQSQRCSGRTIPGLDAGALAGANVGRDPKLNAKLFIDGFPVPDITALSDLRPHQIEAIEVYQGAAQLPAEARGDSCFAIFVWLRSG